MIKIAFLGDIALIGQYDKLQNDSQKIFRRLKEISLLLKDCDFVIGNLECPLTNLSFTKEAKTLALRSAPSNVELLKWLHISAVSLSNNHIYDYDSKGVFDTIEALKKNNIEYYGLNKKTVILSKNEDFVELGGFCCLSANGWHYDIYHNGQLNTLSLQNVKAFMNKASKDNAFPILTFHWGDENTHYPRLEHIMIAKNICEKKNTAIIGHHPHVIQGIESINNSIVAYSLGNLCFDDFLSDNKCKVQLHQNDDNKKGYIIILSISNRKIVDYSTIGYIDSKNCIEVSESINNELNSYSSGICNIDDRRAYNNMRKHEIETAHHERLGKKDFKWFIRHINSTAFKAVIQRKINKIMFKKVVNSFRKDHFNDQGK